MGEIRNSFQESRRLTWAEAGFPFTDARAAKPWKDFGAGLVFGDAAAHATDYRRVFEESVVLVDETARSAEYVRALSGGLSLADGFSWCSMRLLRLVDSFGFSEDRTRRMDYGREYVERLPFADLPAQTVGKSFFVPLSLKDRREETKGFHGLHKEALSMKAAFSPRSVFLHEYVEHSRVKEMFAQTFSLSRHEGLRVKESLLRPADVVLSNIALQDKPFDMSSFRTLLDTAPGYEPFMPYNVGEYEYKDALTRLKAEAGVYGAEPVVFDAVIHVDIEDTVDRGAVVITDTSRPTRVYFNKRYYTTPEVSVTLQGGNAAAGVVTPNICVIDKDEHGFYFDVELIRSDKTRAQGRVTWSAVGY